MRKLLGKPKYACFPSKEARMIFRISQKLNEKLNLHLSHLPPEENPYGDWTAHLFTAKRTQYIIISNTASLYSVVIYGRGITDPGRFVGQAIEMIQTSLKWEGKAFFYERFLMPSMNTVQFSKSISRSTTGSINELVRVAKRILEEEDIPPSEVGKELNQVLLSAIAEQGDLGFCTPENAFKRLLPHSAR